MTNLPGVGVEAIIGGLNKYLRGSRTIQDEFGKSDRAANAFAKNSELLSAKTIALGNILANVATGAVRAFGNALAGSLREGIDSVAKYERLQLSLNSLVARELAQGQEIEQSRQVRAQLTKAEVAELEKLEEQIKKEGLQRDTLGARIQEQKQRIIQLTASYGENGLNVQTARARLAEMENQLASSGDEVGNMVARIAELNAKNGQMITITEKARINQMSMDEALSQSGEKAEELIKWIEQLAVKSPFGQDEVSEGFRQALSYDFTTEKAKELTVATLDYLAATGQSGVVIERVVAAMGQMKSVNKAQLQDLKQLINAGVNVTGVLEGMGFTLEDASKGLISADAFYTALIESFKIFEGAAEEQANTFTGLIESMGDLKDIRLREFWQETFDTIKPLMIGFVDFLTSEEGQQRILEIGHILATKVATALERIQTIIGTFQKGGFGGVATALGLTPDVIELGDKFAESFGRIKDTISGFFSSLSEATGDNSPLDILNKSIEFVNENFEAFEGAIIGIGGALAAAAVVGGIVALGGAIVGLLNPITGIIIAAGALGAAWNTNFLGIQDVVQDVWTNVIQPVFESMKTLFFDMLSSLQTAWGAFRSLFEGDVTGWLEGLSKAWQQYFSGIGTFAATLWSMVSPHLETLVTNTMTWVSSTDWPAVGRTITTAIGQGLGEIWTFALPHLTALYNNAISWLESVDWVGIGLRVVALIDEGFFQLRLLAVTTLTAWHEHIALTLNNIDWTEIGRIVGRAIATGLGAIWLFITETIPSFFKSAQEGFDGLDWESIGHSIVEFFTVGLGKFVTETLPQWLEDIWTWFTEQTWEDLGTAITDGFIQGLENARNAVQRAAGNFGEGFIEGFQSTIDSRSPSRVFDKLGRNTVAGLVQGVVATTSLAAKAIETTALVGIAALRDLKQDYIDVGKDIVKGFIKGIEERREKFLETLKDLAASGWDRIQKFLGIKSPSTLFAEVGRNIVQGLIEGIVSWKQPLNSVLEEMFDLERIISGGSFSSLVQKELSSLNNSIKESEATIDSLSETIATLEGIESLTVQQTFDLMQSRFQLGQVTEEYERQLTAVAEKERVLNKLQKERDRSAFLKDQLNFIKQARAAGFGDLFEGINFGPQMLAEELVDLQGTLLSEVNKQLEHQLQAEAIFGGIISDLQKQRIPLEDLITPIAVGGRASGLVKSFETSILGPLADRIKTLDTDFLLVQERLLNQSPNSGLVSFYNMFLNVNTEERVRLMEKIRQEQEKIYKIQKLQSQLDFLDQQKQLLDMIKEHNLDSFQILGAMTLGVNADSGELLDAMAKAMQAVIDQTNSQLQIGSPSKVFQRIGENMGAGVEVGLISSFGNIDNFLSDKLGMMARGPVNSGAGYGGGFSGDTIINHNNNFGNNTISNGMSEAAFEARVIQVLKKNIN